MIILKGGKVSVQTCVFGEIYQFLFTKYYIFQTIGFECLFFHKEMYYPIIWFYFHYNCYEEIGSQVTQVHCTYDLVQSMLFIIDPCKWSCHHWVTINGEIRHLLLQGNSWMALLLTWHVNINAVLYLIYNVVETWQSDGPRIEGEGVKTLLS